MTAAALPENRPRVVLIDLSSIFYAAWHSSGNDAISMAKSRTLDTIRVVASKGGLVAICCDLGKSFRKDLFPAYKANRPDKDQNMLGELERVRERLRADGHLLWAADGFEADDVIATATLAARTNGHEVLIASADKDLLQLVGGGVRQLRTHTMKEMGATELMTETGIGPSQFGDWLALVGDKSDNIPGAPGVGPKTATALLRAFTNLETLYTTLGANPKAVTDAVGRNAFAMLKSLEDNAKAVELSRKLVALRTDAPIRFADIYEERTAEPLTIFEEEPDMSTDAKFEDARISAPPPATAVPTTPAAPGPPPGPPAPAPTPVATAPMPPPVEMPEEPEAKPTRALALVPPTFDLALEPTNAQGALWLAKGMLNSRLFLKYTNEFAIWATIIRGREMGIPALTALDVFHVIEGKPAMHAHLIIARAEAHPDCEYFMQTHSDDKFASYETKNHKHPKPVSHTYRIEDAVAAGLCELEAKPRAPGGGKDSRSNWDKRRAEMLRKTCAVQLARIVYPGASLGLHAVEELEGDAD